jgi:hypothetical protein
VEEHVASTTHELGGETVAVTPRYVDWGAILAGSLFAAAIGLALLAFGSGIGFSLISPIRGEGFSRIAFVAAAGLWLVLVQAASNTAGGYMAGRLRTRSGTRRDGESEIRDSAHGLAVWAVAALISAAVTAMAAGGVIKTGTAVAPSTTPSSRADGDPFRYTADMMFRADRPTGSAVERELAVQEAARVLAVGAVRRDVPPEDRAHLARLVVSHTGLPAADAQRRVDQVLTRAADDAQRAADAARKTGVLLAFVTAAALLVGALSAWWAAGMGGRHRDEGTYPHMLRWPATLTR